MFHLEKRLVGRAAAGQPTSTFLKQSCRQPGDSSGNYVYTSGGSDRRNRPSVRSLHVLPAFLNQPRKRPYTACLPARPPSLFLLSAGRTAAAARPEAGRFPRTLSRKTSIARPPPALLGLSSGGPSDGVRVPAQRGRSVQRADECRRTDGRVSSATKRERAGHSRRVGWLRGPRSRMI